MNIGVFIDLNTYRLTANMLNSLLNRITLTYDIDSLIYYNYSPQTHRDLPIAIANTREFGSGRRKVLIDMREVCDMVEYATAHAPANVFAICGLLDSERVWEKLHDLNATIILGATQALEANVNEVYIIDRQPPSCATMSQDVAPSFLPPQMVNSANVATTITRMNITNKEPRQFTTTSTEKLANSSSVSSDIIDNAVTIPNDILANNTLLPQYKKSNTELTVSNEILANKTVISNERLDNSKVLSKEKLDDYDSKLREIDSLITALYR